MALKPRTRKPSRQDGPPGDPVAASADPALLAEDTVTVAIQVNGKLRTTLEFPKNLPNAEAEALALAHPSVVSAIAGKSVKKTIVVPGRIVNVVAA